MPADTRSVTSIAAASAFILATAPGVAVAQPGTDLGRFFGFGGMRIIVVDDNCGPLVTGDFNNDGRPDLAVVNNAKSRIEVHSLRETEMTEAERERNMKVNDLPPNPWYDRVDISVSQRVTAVREYDVDGDGKLDLVYAGANPSELVILRQENAGKYVNFGKRRVSGLATQQAGFRLADVLGDGAPEIIATANSKIHVFPFGKDGVIADPVKLGSSGDLVATFVEDYNGDGLADLLAAAPDDASPLRLWLQRQDSRVTGKSGLLPSEIRFEMPDLREVEPVRFPERKAASIGVIERASKRIVFYDLVSKEIEQAAADERGVEREVQAEVTAFADDSGKDRSVALADLNGDGQVDLVATDFKDNTIVLYSQRAGLGFGSGEPFSAFKNPKSVAVGQWDGGGTPEVFVLSEEEKAVGVASYDAQTGRLSFPKPLAVKTDGANPVAVSHLDLGAAPTLGVIVKDKRDHTLELHQLVNGQDDITAVKLESVSRPPQSMIACDADQDGRADVLLFTPGEPMVMVRATGDADPTKAWTVLTDKTMPQFGLVQSAGPTNTAILDVDGNGSNELIIADQNFVRACVYDPAGGWRVVDQVTVSDPGTVLVGLTSLKDGDRTLIFAADKGNGRILRISPSSAGGKVQWRVTDRMKLLGFTLDAIYAGSFGGDGQPSILCVSDDGFALVRLAGQRPTLEQFAAYRTDKENRVEHEIEVGDLNGDGHVDAVVLDAGEQMCELFTFSATRKLYPATEFEVFETRLFSGGEPREFEPRSANLADITGDGAMDVILTVHDRIMIYPQMKK